MLQIAPIAARSDTTWQERWYRRRQLSPSISIAAYQALTAGFEPRHRRPQCCVRRCAFRGAYGQQAGDCLATASDQYFAFLTEQLIEAGEFSANFAHAQALHDILRCAT